MRQVALTQGRFAIVDDDDFALVSGFSWQAMISRTTAYARRFEYVDGVRRAVIMHRWLLNAPDGVQVDHRNGNGLDNRRENIRLATPSQNATNWRRPKREGSSRYRGVWWNRKDAIWQAGIATKHVDNGKTIHLGCFDSEIAAARAYDRAAIEHHGDFAVTNFPKESYV